VTVVYGLLCLGFIIFFHELGHFLAARISGVSVEAFSVGMGPVLLHKKIHTTDYRISLFPIGGYCAMKGEKDFSNAIDANLKTIIADKDSLYGVHALKRILIAFSGPFFNLFFAFASFTVIAMTGYTYYSPSAEIVLADEVYPGVHSAARDAGLRTGDTVLSINGKKISDFSDISSEISTHPDETVTIVVCRKGSNLSFQVHTDMDKSEGTGKIGIASTPDSVKKHEVKTYSFFPAISKGIQETGSIILLTIKSITVLFKGVDVTNAVSGPARITAMLGETVKEGFSASIRTGIVSTLQFLALISVSLFILNLLPVPILDGGMILFAGIETITGRQVPPRIQYYVQYIGIAFIVFLLVLGISGDIRYFMKLLEKK